MRPFLNSHSSFQSFHRTRKGGSLFSGFAFQSLWPDTFLGTPSWHSARALSAHTTARSEDSPLLSKAELLASQAAMISLLINLAHRRQWPSKTTHVPLWRSADVSARQLNVILTTAIMQQGSRMAEKKLGSWKTALDAISLQVPGQIKFRFTGQIVTFNYYQKDSNGKSLPYPLKSKFTILFCIQLFLFSCSTVFKIKYGYNQRQRVLQVIWRLVQ